MAEVQINLKLSASEFQTLRYELEAHRASLLAGAKAARSAQNLSDANALVKREAKVAFLLERLG